MKVCNIQNFKYNNFSISTLILIYADGMLSVAPKFSYQISIKRTYFKELNYFYITSFSILQNKEQTTYEILLEKNKKKKNSSKYYNILNVQKNFHCDFKIWISNTAKKVFPNINIRYCFFTH